MLKPEEIKSDWNEIVRGVIQLRNLWNRTSESFRATRFEEFDGKSQTVLSRSGLGCSFRDGLDTLLSNGARTVLEDMFVPVEAKAKAETKTEVKTTGKVKNE